MKREFPASKIIKDRDGYDMKIGVFRDKFVPPFGDKYFEQIKSFTVKDSDVFSLWIPQNRMSLDMGDFENDSCSE